MPEHENDAAIRAEVALLDTIFAYAEQQGLFDTPKPIKTEASAEDLARFAAWAASTTIAELERGWRELLEDDLIDYRRNEPLWRSELGEEPRIFYVRRWREFKHS